MKDDTNEARKGGCESAACMQGLMLGKDVHAIMSVAKRTACFEVSGDQAWLLTVVSSLTASESEPLSNNPSGLPVVIPVLR